MFKRKVPSQMKDLISDEGGTVALEYGMIASLVAVAAITGLTPLGNNLGTSFKAAADAISSGSEPVAPPPPAGSPTSAPAMMAPLRDHP